MAKVWAIAANALHELLRKRIGYLAVFLAALLVVQIYVVRDAAGALTQYDDPRGLDGLVGRSLRMLLETWHFLSIVLTLAIGAQAVSSELRTRTIVTVLARPVERWQYLLGRWLGVQVYFVLFYGLAVPAVLVLTRLFDTPLQPLFWVALLQQATLLVLVGSVSAGLGAHVPPVLAGTLAFLMYAHARNGLVPDALLYSEAAGVRLPLLGAYYLLPAHLPTSVLGEALGPYVRDPGYPLLARVMLENTLYGLLVLAFSAVFFGRRDLRLNA